MKTKITFFFLLCSLFAFSQEVLSDTAYLSRRVNPDHDKNEFGGKDTIFFVVRDIKYSTGYRSLTELPIGDTTQVVNYFAALASQESDQLAAGAKEVIRKGEKAQALNLYSDLIQQATGTQNVFTALRDAFRGRYEAGKWRMITPTKNLLGVIKVLPNGNVIFNPDANGEPSIVCRIFRKQVRIINAPGAGTVDVYEFDTNRFATIEKTRNLPTVRLVQVIETTVQNQNK